MPAARLDGTERTPTSHTHVHTPTETHTVERTMVVQGAVTPGRTRRLMLKLPVGTLRRNSGERVRQGFPLSFLCLTFFLTCAGLSEAVSVFVVMGRPEYSYSLQSEDFFLDQRTLGLFSALQSTV